MKTTYFLLGYLMVLICVSACTEEMETVNDSRRMVEVSASMPESGTRASLTQESGTFNLIAKWKEDDKIRLYILQGGKDYELDPVPIYNISADGKSCMFGFQLPYAVNPESPYEIFGLCDAVGEPLGNENIVLVKCKLKRMPWSSYTAPLWFHATGGPASLYAEFRHMGTYEILHVKNTSTIGVMFSHSGFDVEMPWWEDGYIPLSDDYDPAAIVEEPSDDSSSPSVFIPAGQTKDFLSWYIPSGASIKDASLLATIDGKKITSSNKKNSNVKIQLRHAYHMYATWDGKELKFDKTDVIEGKVIKVEPEKISFGNVPVGTSKTEHFTVSNVGTSSLTFNVSDTHDGGYDIPESGKEYTLSAGESKIFDVNFTPKEVGTHYTRIVRIYSDAENGTQYINISGTGVEGSSEVQTETFTVNGVSFKMVAVEGGTFWMGAADDDSQASRDERPRHQVTLSSYAIGETEVTQALWEAVMGEEPSWQWSSGYNYPVERVSWDECQEFITLLNALTGRNFRLPTEAEWEYAARGGKYSHGYKYAGSDDIDEVAWYEGNDNTLHPVAAKKTNELGLYDMSGNVWEWCQDWYDGNYYNNSSAVNPCNNTENHKHAYRGGSGHFEENWCRVTARCRYGVTCEMSWPDGSDSFNCLGLRLVLGTLSSDESHTFHTCPDDHHPHMIDLGLPSGTKWACCNVGANSPEGNDSYYAWGETEEKGYYDWNTYTHCDGSAESCHHIGDDIAGTEYDVAHMKWGGSWRMPTRAQQDELRESCTREWTQLNGVNGIKVTGPNGNSIFLPAGGVHWYVGLISAGEYGYYWSSSLDPNGEYGANYLNFYSNDWGWNYFDRSSGLSVRAVISPEKPQDYPVAEAIDLGLPSGTKWASWNVGASKPEEYGGYYAWGETEETDAYGYDTYNYYDETDGWIYIGNDIAGTEYDVAHVKWGGSWRMPTRAQQEELRECCIGEWTQLNGVNGIKVTGPNGNTIFLPAAGVRDYDGLKDDGEDGNCWSSSLDPDDEGVAYLLNIDSRHWYWSGGGSRCLGFSVRPVCP